MIIFLGQPCAAARSDAPQNFGAAAFDVAAKKRPLVPWCLLCFWPRGALRL